MLPDPSPEKNKQERNSDCRENDAQREVSSPEPLRNRAWVAAGKARLPGGPPDPPHRDTTDHKKDQQQAEKGREQLGPDSSDPAEVFINSLRNYLLLFSPTRATCLP